MATPAESAPRSCISDNIAIRNRPNWWYSSEFLRCNPTIPHTGTILSVKASIGLERGQVGLDFPWSHRRMPREEFVPLELGVVVGHSGCERLTVRGVENCLDDGVGVELFDRMQQGQRE